MRSHIWTIATLGLIVWVAVFLTASMQSESSHSTRLSGAKADLFKEISEELICQCGCNLVLGQCGHINCPSAIPMRNMVEEMILAGKTKREMLDWFMTEYRFENKPPAGKAILSQPETKGFDLVAWIMPFALLVVFTVVTVYVVTKFSRRKPAAPASTSTSDDEYQRRIEADLKKIE